MIAGLIAVIYFGWPYTKPLLTALLAKLAAGRPSPLPTPAVAPAGTDAAPVAPPAPCCDRHAVEHLLSAADRARADGKPALADSLLGNLPALAKPAEKTP